MKANNAERCENARFHRLAQADLCEHLKKKNMKALIPQIIQFMYFGALFLFCACYLSISRGSFNGRDIISFVMSLVFLIEPIQVRLHPEKNFHCIIIFWFLLSFLGV